MKPFVKTFWILCFAIAMGYLESSVVVYLRELYYPAGFKFPMKEMSEALFKTELFREAATLIMLLAVSVLAANRWIHRFAWFLIIFAVWDLVYYIFLKVILNWPSSFLTTDILFLLPSLWTGPVFAPIINSLTMLLFGTAVLGKRRGLRPVSRLPLLVWVLLIAGAILILVAYTGDFASFALHYKRMNPGSSVQGEQLMFSMSTQFIPRSFDWLLFGIGVVSQLTAVFLLLRLRQKHVSYPARS